MKAHVTSGVIDVLPVSQFPNSWKDPVTGNTWSKLGLETLTTPEQEALGWFNVVTEVPTIDENLQRLGPEVITFETTYVKRSREVWNLSNPEKESLRQKKINLRAQEYIFDNIAGGKRDLEALIAELNLVMQGLEIVGNHILSNVDAATAIKVQNLLDKISIVKNVRTAQQDAITNGTSADAFNSILG